VSNARWSAIRFFALIIGSILFFPVSCTVSSAVGYAVIVKNDQRDVSRGDTVHKGFMVVVEPGENGAAFRLLSLGEVSAIKQISTTNTFLMSAPKGRTPIVDGWQATYIVLTTQGNTQTIEVVSGNDDGAVTSRYRATAQNIEPLFSRKDYFGHAFSALPLGLAAGLLIWIFGLLLRKKYCIQAPEIQL
jgi:hypothetical protein